MHDQERDKTKEPIIDFLKGEYELTWNSWKFNHEDRNKYVAIYVSLIGGLGYAFFWAAKRSLLLEASFVSLVFGLINLFFLRWFKGHRASSVNYINHLNRIRGELLTQCRSEKVDDKKLSEIRRLILPVDDLTNKSCDIPYSRENEFNKILYLLIGIGAFLFAYLFLLKWMDLECPKCCIAAIALFLSVGAIIFACCSSRNYQKRRSSEYRELEAGAPKDPGDKDAG